MLVDKKFFELLLEEFVNANTDDEGRWITIKPHGDDSEDYRRLKLRKGESPKEAIDRVYKKEDKDKDKDKEKEKEKEKKEDNIDTDFNNLKNTTEKVEYFKKLDISKLTYKKLEKVQDLLEVFLLESLEFSDRKELQKILFSISDRKQRQEAIEKSKEIGGYTEKLQKLTNFSHLSDISSFPIELQKHIYNNYKKVYDKYPQLAKVGYGKLAKENLGSSTYANNLSIANGITLNSTWYDNLTKLEKSYENDVKLNYHPQGTDYNSIITHELGHSLLSYITLNTGITGAKIRANILKKLNIKQKDVDKYLSVYAMKKPKEAHEFFAEAFAEYMTSKNPRPLAVEFGKEIDNIIKFYKLV